MPDKRRMLVVPLRWKLLSVLACFLAILLYISFKIADANRFTILHFMVYSYLAVAVSAFLRVGVNYAFCNEYLEARLFGIPFWRIRWDRIRKATYLHAWKDIVPKYSAAMGGVVATIGNSYEQMIYVTLRGCPRYHPQYEIRLVHNLLHPFRTACIWLPYATKYQYIEAFKEHYPDLEMQPLDDWKKF